MKTLSLMAPISAPAIHPLTQVLPPVFSFFLFTLGFYGYLDYNEDYMKSKEWREQGDVLEIYDFIVVGGGSAGAAVANRLSQHNRVLVLEIGGNPHPLSTFGGGLIGVPGADLNYKTAPQNNSALSLGNQSLHMARGMGLGGSSNINFMIYQRGNSRDYDNWANITGNPEWSYANILPFFKKMEDYNGAYPNEKYHGKGGPIHVEKIRYTPMANVFLAAAKEKGYPIGDTNSGEPQGKTKLIWKLASGLNFSGITIHDAYVAIEFSGFSQVEATSKRGLRSSTYTGYIKPILSRKNLRIYRHSRVVKVHLDKRRRAYGVTYIRFGISRFVRSSKEIIVSAGAIDSPKILMLSGIGPKEHLHSIGLKCRVNLPVGQNLQDHIGIPQMFLVNSTESIMPSRVFIGPLIRDFVLHGSGLIASNGLSALGFHVDTSAARKDSAWPDIQYMFAAAGVFPAVSFAFSAGFNVPLELMQKFMSSYFGHDGNAVLQVIVRPESRGEVKLASKDPLAKPIIQPNYYSHINDIKTMVKGSKILVNLMENTKAYKAIKGQYMPVPFPGCEHLKFRSDAYYECYVRHLTLTIYHPVGTAAMGKNLNDTRAVVDSELRVFKTKGLRVIDASIMPVIVNANTNAPTIMIGELGSFFIRRYWAGQYEICPRQNDWFSIYPNFELDHKCYYSRLV